MYDLGSGKFVAYEGKIMYDGSIPKDCLGEPVIILRQEDLDSIIERSRLALLSSKCPMEEFLYDQSEGLPAIFSDQISIETGGNEVELFLDRTLYSFNPKDMFFVRYVSVDQSLREEADK